ncbi:unnamed protein product [Rhizophagus irregularis]|nr:unnamed protein product [Rhizophagus irregularis]
MPLPYSITNFGWHYNEANSDRFFWTYNFLESNLALWNWQGASIVLLICQFQTTYMPAWMPNYYIQSSGRNCGIVLAEPKLNKNLLRLQFPALSCYFLATFSLLSKNIQISNLVRGHGMEIEELEMLFTYKFERNEKVHRDSLNRGATALVRSQQLQHALRILHLAPDQPQGFPEAFEKCAEWIKL